MNTQKFVENISTKNIEWLVDLKTKCDDYYHNKGNSLISDEQYDLLVDNIKKKNNKIEITIGAPVESELNKKKLPFNMGSMNKIKPENKKELSRWLEKNHSDLYVVEPKLDGISCLLVCKNNTVNLYTRGDGKTGTDITSILNYLSNIPILNENINIRGELIIDKKQFEKKYSDKFSNPRNFVSGVIMSKIVNIECLADISFVPYEIINETSTQTKPTTQLKTLTKLGFDTIDYKLFKTLNISTLTNTLRNFKDSLKYELDGVILQPNTSYSRNTSGNPSYAMAFKVQGAVYTTTVKDVIWQVSKWGKIVPRIKVDTVNIDGVNVSYTSGFNAKYIVDNKIGIGSIINITRSGDVIPYIVDIVSSSTTLKLPDVKYKWSDSQVDFELVDDDNDEKSIKKILAFFKGIGVKYLNIQTVSKLYNNGFTSIFLILEASVSDFEKIDGFKNKMAVKLHDSIHNDKNYTLCNVLGSAGVFGEGISDKKLKKLFEKNPNILKDYIYLSKEELMNTILNVEGFSSKSALKIVDNLNNANDFACKINKYYNIIKEETVTVESNNTKLNNKKIVFTGFRDKLLEEKAIKFGATIVSSVSKNTDMVVVKETNIIKPSSKIIKARELGIDIIDKITFEKVFF